MNKRRPRACSETPSREAQRLQETRDKIFRQHSRRDSLKPAYDKHDDDDKSPERKLVRFLNIFCLFIPTPRTYSCPKFKLNLQTFHLLSRLRFVAGFRIV